MQSLNFELFNFINAGANLHALPLLLSIIVAKYLIYMVPLWLIIYWLWGSPQDRGLLLFAIIAAVLGLCINKIVGFLWYAPRPFVLGMGHTYLTHAADSSFPSDHATFIWAVGLSLLLQVGLRASGIIFLLLAIAVGWARVFLGIHFPFDILGGFITATFAVVLLSGASNWINRQILPIVETFYRKLFAKAIVRKLVQE